MKKLTLITAIILAVCTSSAQIINIPADYPTIQQGIDAAVNNDIVLVQPGTYVENINYLGKDIIVASLFLTTEDTAYISQTIIDGNQNGSVVSFENGESQNALLTGFTLTNGYSASSGGAISCVYHCNPKLENLIISGNSAQYNGGAIICGAGGSPGLANVTITNNSAGFDGGGIYCYNFSNPTLENVTISGNNSAHYGGGFYCLQNCYPHLKNVTISGNSSSKGGGILCAVNSAIYCTNVKISNNEATQNAGGAGLSDDSEGFFINCSFTGNTSNYGSALKVGGGGTADATNCIFWGNSNTQIALTDNNSLGGTLTVEYCDVQNGIDSIEISPLSTLNWGDGNIDQNPVFVNQGDNPYQISDSSPCIDAGTPDTTGLNLPEFDLAGEVRIFNNRVDIGAYEWNTFVGVRKFEAQSSKFKVWNYPNPFTTFTTITYELNQQSTIQITIYNHLGEQIEVIRQKQSTGKKQVFWNAEELPAGVYFCVLKSNEGTKTTKMIKLQ